MSRRILTTNEIVDVLESLDDNEVGAIDVYMDPPCEGMLSDGDSGDEDCQNIERLNRHQLLAPAELVLQKPVDSDAGSNQNDVDINEPCSSQTVLSEARLQRKRKRLHESSNFESNVQSQPSTSNSTDRIIFVRQPRIRNWVKRDLPKSCQENSNWNAPFPRVVLTLSDASEPLEFFELFFSEDVINHIVRHSVMYAVLKDHNTNFTLSVDEMKCFLGILILSGYAPLPRRRMYWETNEDTHNVLVSKSMRRNRFEEIFRYLHVADNDNLQPNDKMAKVRPLFDMLNEKFLLYAPMEKNFSVDESMVPYYGRHGCKQHIHGKPIRFGFKAWVAATRLGYCLHADLYEGRSERRETSLGEHVVIKLTGYVQNVYPDHQFSVFCDNFFTCPSLLSTMQEKNVKITGTARQNRIDKCPLYDVNLCKKKARGFYDYKLDTSDKICAVRWNDNSVVTLLSNEFGVQPIQKASRYSVAEKKRVEIDQPNLIHQYNRYMGGVDRLDANIGVYRIAIRGKKWYIPLLMWLVDVGLNNATLLARSFGARVDTLEFRRSVARVLLLKYGSASLQPGPQQILKSMVPSAVRKHNAQHMIVTGQNRRRCALCENKTVKMCTKCQVNLHDKCFAEFHSRP